ncbi:MAG: hypothetical protein EOS54_23570 [Mesorhizobium sp.]|uniref:hypothetical protein n=1 Tax=unclassified Mesorhizobium TaxID=325217 RepID=UPI000F74DF05|nr:MULTISPECIES: hypothetical protein [unclassified Mesorhizobium]AZO50123.1 hypothetical protein EJ073_21640 [Mesorhizobium sp. M4B.F.Ca.ET.058.02.1.1]RWC48090.1 MAG: hypothetical protein EOS54_23570 [Mesorhizobium sp.]RWD09823.1 MAG: hypothetical protein EOS74_30760 [Mesorhizobium sp.]RWD51155.1 MAG: hypothetical protein EOS75_32355 [Mesorhizobium sp.]TIU66602.1 MAG: hypothetical protein E5W25_17600 [Mesorhizobium sp.]
MTDQLTRLRPTVAWATLAVLLAVGGAQSAATLKGNPALPADTQTAEQMFADAPDGVDPVVTGAVSAAFKQRQKDAGCDSAVWPKIPAVCYPD